MAEARRCGLWALPGRHDAAGACDEGGRKGCEALKEKLEMEECSFRVFCADFAFFLSFFLSFFIEPSTQQRKSLLVMRPIFGA